MTDHTIDYAAFIDAAMRNVVRVSLRQVEQTGLPGEHHFFISFRTDYPGVSLSEALRARYPEEMTIVVQHQFQGLKVEDERFSIVLSFNNIPEKLVIPFAALTAFADPSVKFGLQFHVEEAGDGQPPPSGGWDEASREQGEGGAEIIALDAFRKK